MKYPHRHDDIRYYLGYLSDAGYQQRVWVQGERPHPDERFDDIIHFFFDDTNLADNVEGCIGWFVRDLREASYIRAVVEAMDVVLNKYGTELTDAEYVAKPEWAQVLATAKAALAVVSEPGRDAPA